MDLTLPLIGVLGLIGHNVNKQLNSRDYTERRTKIPDSEKSNTNSIYSSKEYNRFYEQEKQAYEKIRENNDTVTFNSKSDALMSSKSTLEPKRISEPDENAYRGQDIFPSGDKIFNGPMFTSDKYFIQQDSSTSFTPSVEGFSDISPLSGQKTNFSHQNMVPFFGGRLKNANTSNTLGRYTGTDNLTPKKEVESVQNGPVNDVFGNVLLTDSITQDRFVSSNYQTSLLPFDQVRVQPIPGEYNRGGAKTVDELRSSINPKLSLEGRMNTGKTIDKRANMGELPETRFETAYELGTSRQFTTKGQENGSYFDSTQHFRESKKNITSEISFNTSAGVNYIGGSRLRANKKDDGVNTLVQEDKRGNWVGDWVRSRKTVSINCDDIPTTENLKLRSQQRETGNRKYLGNATSRIPANRQRTDENLKTTNKELSLYSYKGISNGNNIKKPDDRTAWYKNETKTKGTMEFTPGGKKANSPGVGKSAFNFETKNRANPSNYIGSSSVLVQSPTSSSNMGNVSKSKFSGYSRDFSERLNQTFQKQSLDRPLTKLSNKTT
jgi:hypothetical protein